MDLFEQGRKAQIEKESPLANRMRPRTLDEYVGQEHIIGPGRLLRRAIQADQLSSLIFYGPPGTGKTTLAMVIANTTRSHFITINAVLAGVKQIREAIATAQERRNLYNQRTTLFVDEVHRWNKAQQDALLPHVEKGTIILIGATTENPYFEVNKALVSRSRIFQLRPLNSDNLRQIAINTLQDAERGFGKLNVEMHDDALDHLVDIANGDARGVLNALELALETTQPNDDSVIVIDLTVAEESIQRRAVLYDKEGDVHYDTISAFIKSLRGSDPDAALYWMAKMVYAGEDPRFIFRRMTIFAGEDVGMADPNAMSVVTGCWQAFERIGMPEGRFPLSQACIYLATAPKSNSTFAFFDALGTVEKEQEADVPNHLKDGNRDKEGFGHGQGYLYPHAYRDHWVAQQYLPDSMQGKVFYQPSDQGYERSIRDQVARKREEQLAGMVASGEWGVASGEILTTSPVNKGKDAWLQRTVESSGRSLGQVRDRLFELAGVQRHHLVLDVNAGTGLLTWEAVRKAPEGGVWALTADQQAGEALRQQAERLPELERPFILIGSFDELEYLMALRGDEAIHFDRVLARNLFTQDASRVAEMAKLIREWLGENGRFCLAQTIPQYGQRLYDLVDWKQMPKSIYKKVQAAEETIYADTNNSMINWNETDLENRLGDAGFSQINTQHQQESQQRRITVEHIDRWFSDSDSYASQITYAQRLKSTGITPKDLKKITALYRQQLQDQIVRWHVSTAYLISER
ncbi:MAG: AAA family ATPase [Chloroflexi bacterium]|nr:MAG: AAA family ATPase [Chloroflexota bacterium]